MVSRSECATYLILIGKSPQDYIKAICRREIAWIDRYAVPKSSHNLFSVSVAQNTPGNHIVLYKKLLDIADFMLPKNREIIRSTIWHWDIDWQDVWAGPLFFQAQYPRLVRYSGEVILKLPEHYDSLTDEEEKARIRTQVERSILQWMYESETKTANPKLYELFNVPQWRTRCDAMEFGANTWDGDILPFRQCLIRIAR